MPISKEVKSRPFDYQIKLHDQAMGAQFYQQIFQTPTSEYAVIKGLQVICCQMVVYFDGGAFTGWQFDFPNGVVIQPWIGGNPLVGANRRASGPVPDVTLLPSDGFGFPNQTVYAYNIEVPFRQEFGMLFTPTAMPWINNGGDADLILRAYGHYYNKADWKGLEND